MDYPKFRNVIDLARAHGLAIKQLGGRQAWVTIQFYKANAKVFSFPTCLGACHKCDKHWIEIKQELSSIEMIDVRLREEHAGA